MDAQGPVLRIQDGAGRNRSRIPDLSGTEKYHGERIHHPRLALVRDIFVFAAFTGLAFANVSTLTKDNLVQDNNGDWWIRKGRVKLERRHRASSVCNIPLLPVPLAILKKYEEHPICRKKKPLPACHMQSTHEQLFEGNR